MKYISMIIILAVCSSAGVYFSISMKKRVTQLCDVINGINTVKNGIICGQTEIYGIFESIVDSGIFSSVVGADGETTTEKYFNAKRFLKRNMFLDNSDWAEIDRFFASVGKSEAEAQIRICDNCIKSIEKRLLSADEKYKRIGGVYAKGGVLAGIFIVILMI